MIKSIDGLTIPPSVDSVSEQINRDSTTQTVSGRLITELDPNPKWKTTVSFPDLAFGLTWQAQFYQKCLMMRKTAATVVLISPYDGTEKQITARCIEIETPEAAAISRKTKAPLFYLSVGATFQEV